MTQIKLLIFLQIVTVLLLNGFCPLSAAEDFEADQKPICRIVETDYLRYQLGIIGAFEGSLQIGSIVEDTGERRDAYSAIFMSYPDRYILVRVISDYGRNSSMNLEGKFGWVLLQSTNCKE